MTLGLSKQDARRLLTFLESGLVDYRHVHPWAFDWIRELDEPPPWLCELASFTLTNRLCRCLLEFVYSEPFEAFEAVGDDFTACLFLRYQRREISWATFLLAAGRRADGNPAGGRWPCEDFYALLNALENAGFAAELEAAQAKEVAVAFADRISALQGDYEALNANRMMHPT